MPTKMDRVEITYTLTFTTLFHCGTGVRAGLVDRTVRRDGKGYLYVPGSTFKGILRERCEQLARFYTDDAGQESIASPHDAEAALRGLGKRPPTMVTRLFGSQTVSGRLFFDDALLRDEDKELYKRKERAENGQEQDQRANRRSYQSLQVDLYTQARMDRPTRTAVDGALYTSEFGTRNITFKGEIQGWLECTALADTALLNERHPAETPTYSLLLLLAGLRMVDRLGGNKSTGKGHCECEITDVKLNGHGVVKDTWLAWLGQVDALTGYDRLEGANAL